MKTLAVGITFLAFAAIASGTFPNGILYPFEIDSLLVCHLDNPLSGLPGEPDTVPEEIPRLSFTQLVTQGNHSNVIWLPENARFRIPPGIPDSQRLLDFLGDDYNPQLTSLARPLSVAPLTCEIAGSVGRSTDGLVSHVAISQDPTPLLDVEQEAFTLMDDQILNDPAKEFNVGLELSRQRLEQAKLNLIDQINTFPELCEVHTGLCPLSTVWAELPNGYFPKFFAQGTCSNKNCSFPRGKLCEEDFSYIGYLNTLRWDCCFNRLDRIVRWDCGWRKVQVPVICDCTCACGEVFHDE